MSRPLRFTFILVLAAVGTVLAAAGGWRYARASAPASGPIIVISIDTLRADHLPAYGYDKVRTPAIDALAADGVLFERAYSHAPQTLPAHAAILSGRLPFETGVRDNVGFTVKPGERLLAQMLHDRGYATGAVVSSFVLRKATGIARGFDFFDDETAAAAPGENVPRVQRDGGASEAVAERWLQSIGSSRAFLFLHLNEPHKPYAPPDRYLQYAPYDGEIAYSDEIVGRLVRYLKTHQLYDRSTIVLLSDHGEGLGDHGEQAHGLFVYDEAIHVPLIVKQEGNAAAGRRVTDLVQHIDLVPTMLQLVKAPVPGALRGRSLKPLLDGTGHLLSPSVYSEALYGRYHFGWSELTALTDDRYRYIKAPREELYDLARDPYELANVADDRTQARLAMRRALDRVAAGASIQRPADISADARERLQELGYVGTQTEVPITTGDILPDPKDKHQILDTYRAAVDLSAGQKWPEAIGLLQQILRDNPTMAGVWTELATYAGRIDRFDLATDGYRHVIELRPSEPDGYLGAARSLLKQRKLDEARAQATRAIDVATEPNGRGRAAAHELLARIALARHDAAAAREEAARAQEANPLLPLAVFVEARLLYDQGKFADALPVFEDALKQQQKTPGGPLENLGYYAGETYLRMERYAEAEAQFLAELGGFPQNARARAGLAAIYAATERRDEAGRVITDMLRITPTPEAYALAARLWTTLGNRPQADAVRAEARRTFDEKPKRGLAR